MSKNGKFARMNPHISALHPYPFEKLATLKGTAPPTSSQAHIALSIGEPKHPTPNFIATTLTTHLNGLANYPTTRGIPELSETIAEWLRCRFNLGSTGPEACTQVLPVNGTREALFSFAQCIVDRSAPSPLVLMPNPFYQIYEGAALLAGAQPYYLNTTKETGYIPDFDSVPDSIWKHCQLLYICSPGNPSGAVIRLESLQKLILLAEQHDFVIASDECYSEIYQQEASPPPGLLQAAYAMGNDSYRRCVVFHSLSKRSNAPGLRSGFVAGDAELLKPYLLYRTYHGCTMPLPTQYASIQAWSDEQHVLDNRCAYREKFIAVVDILKDVLDVQAPEASFYLWPKTPIDDTEFARKLYMQENVTVLPGSYLSRQHEGIIPGQNHVRMALVAPLNDCIDAAYRIKNLVLSL